MRLALATPTPEVNVVVPVALLSGTFEERMLKAADLGYDGVELMVVRPGEIDIGGLRDLTESRGLEVAAVATGAIPLLEGLTLLAADPDVSDRASARLLELIDFAADVGAPLVTIGSFRGRLAWAGEHAQDRLARMLTEACAHGAQRGIRLALEPLNRYESDVINNVDEALSFVEKVGHSHLGVLVDTFHANIEERSIAGSLCRAMAAGRLWHVHLGDSNRLPPGQGHINFSNVVATLDGLGYQGYISAELLPRPDPDAAAAATIGYMRQFMSAWE